MHLIPTKAGEWKRILLYLLKIYVVLAYVARETCLAYVAAANNYSVPQWIVESSFFSTAVIVTGYALCIVGLSFAAGIQYKEKEGEAAFQTFMFILIGLGFLHLSLRGDSAWNWMIPGAAIFANGWIAWCCLSVRRHFKSRALTCWIWACSINLIGEICMQFRNFPDWWKVGPNDPYWRLVHDFPAGDFLQLYWIGYITTGALYVAGLILAIRQMKSKDLLIPSSNTSMFVALGILGLMISLAVSVSVFRHPEFLPAAAINGVACLLALNACRRQVPFAFLCLALASALTITRDAGLDLHYNWQNPPWGSEQYRFELLSIAGILATILWYSGMVLIIQRLANRGPQPARA